MLLPIARYALILIVSTAPAICQTAAPNSAPDAPPDLSSLRDDVATQNKVLQEEVKNQKALARKNEELLKSAETIQQNNQKLLDEKKRIDLENANLLRQSQSLQARIRATSTTVEAKKSDARTPDVRTPEAKASEWSSKDIGGVTVPGTFSNNGGLMTVSGAGEDIWGAKDQFHYSYLPIVGDGALTVRVAGETLTSRHAKAGIMIRETLSEDAPNVFATICPGRNGTALQSRSATAGATATLTGPDTIATPYWLRLTRVGDVFTGYLSPDGTTWTEYGTVAVPMDEKVYIGLAVTSHTATPQTLNIATFDNLTYGAVPPRPAVSTVASTVATQIAQDALKP